jgi:uncharacterized protein YegJ (DUF2314 family)
MIALQTTPHRERRTNHMHKPSQANNAGKPTNAPPNAIFAPRQRSTAPADNAILLPNAATVPPDPNDPRMNAAIAKARATVQQFIDALKTPKPSYYGFSVKMAFTEGNATEHMWLMPISFDGTQFHGTVNNKPEKLTNVAVGQKVAVAPAEITDWMYIDV